MRRNRTTAVLALAQCGLLLAISIAQAATLPVSYTVDSKPLKTGAPDGTMLTVELYENSLCSGVPLASESVAIGDFGITELLKQFKAKGATTTPPKVTRLNLTMEGVTPTSGADLFLKVSGSGVTPVGGDCQAQVSAGPEGSEGPPGPTGPSGTTACAVVPTACPTLSSCSSSCAAGQQVVGGGCSCGSVGSATLRRSFPVEGSPDLWSCNCTGVDNLIAYAVCCP